MNLKRINQTFIKIFPGDISYHLEQRATPNDLYCLVKPVNFTQPQMLIFNETLSEKIGLGAIECDEDIFFLQATYIPNHIKTYSTAYAGHQFGQWAGQLGDGRVIFAGEIVDQEGKSTELQWKGAGATPYSRRGDGRAVLRSSLREYLMSEALHYLGIPTTRALSLSLTGELVERDILYNGNPQKELGAVVMRTAQSFLRFGHFEFLFATENHTLLKELADYCINHFFPEIKLSGDAKYIEWFHQICTKTADLMVEWFRVGFTHGVMNTDNMSILGLSIDFGPFAMLEEYNLGFTPNTTDLPGRRYAFGEQGKVAQWNLWQLANALAILVENKEGFQNSLDQFSSYFWLKHDEMMCRKFGFDSLLPEDESFFSQWQDLVQDLELDYTLFFDKLSCLNEDTSTSENFQELGYHVFNSLEIERLDDFIIKYQHRLNRNTISKTESLKLMASANPKFVLRNYQIYECIQQIEQENYDMLNGLLQAIKSPYRPQSADLVQKRPIKYNTVPGCSSLSCSS